MQNFPLYQLSSDKDRNRFDCRLFQLRSPGAKFVDIDEEYVYVYLCVRGNDSCCGFLHDLSCREMKSRSHERRNPEKAIVVAVWRWNKICRWAHRAWIVITFLIGILRKMRSRHELRFLLQVAFFFLTFLIKENRKNFLLLKFTIC